jgi:quercetin dioxygenase-like cupin family protein
VDLTAGDVLILQPGSEHRILNTSDTDRLHTITVMAVDGGFADLVDHGTPAPLTRADIHTLATGFSAS